MMCYDMVGYVYRTLVKTILLSISIAEGAMAMYHRRVA
jgi:hypothetical protein